MQAVAKWPETAVPEGKTPGGVPLQIHFATACMKAFSDVGASSILFCSTVETVTSIVDEGRMVRLGRRP